MKKFPSGKNDHEIKLNLFLQNVTEDPQKMKILLWLMSSKCRLRGFFSCFSSLEKLRGKKTLAFLWLFEYWGVIDDWMFDSDSKKVKQLKGKREKYQTSVPF